jgi:hypothetical protein
MNQRTTFYGGDHGPSAVVTAHDPRTADYEHEHEYGYD